MDDHHTVIAPVQVLRFAATGITPSAQVQQLLARDLRREAGRLDIHNECLEKIIDAASRSDMGRLHDGTPESIRRYQEMLRDIADMLKKNPPEKRAKLHLIVNKSEMDSSQ